MYSNALLAVFTATALPLASAQVIHEVFVGGTGMLAFTPDQITAAVGDSVRFTFGPKNHTVTQSTFANPCTQITNTNGEATGFFSGFMPVPATQTSDLPQFQIPVTTTDPIWAFCSQTGHCEQGMVFAVNAPAAPAPNSFDNFVAKAKSLSSTGSSNTGGSPATTAAAAASTETSPTNNEADPYGGGGGYGGSTDSGAATTPAAAAASTTVPGAAATHTVVVGGSAGLVYTPNVITANPGDVVEFQFQVKNHTVTQSTFAAPCGASAGGFDSGFMPVAATATTFPTYSLTVNDTKPIWGYCRQTGHCAQGMVFAINPNQQSANNFTAFVNNAKNPSSAASPTESTSASTASKSVSGAVGGVVANARMTIASLALVAIGFGVLL